MATRIISITPDPADLFATLGSGGFGTLKTPGASFKVQNIGQTTVRYASAAVKPTDLSRGFRLGAGAEKEIPVSHLTTWAWVASGAGRLAMEV